MVQEFLKQVWKPSLEENVKGASAELWKGNGQLQNSLYSIILVCNKERERKKKTDKINMPQFVSSVYH